MKIDLSFQKDKIDRLDDGKTLLIDGSNPSDRGPLQQGDHRLSVL
jgi:hypothetical protein